MNRIMKPIVRRVSLYAVLALAVLTDVIAVLSRADEYEQTALWQYAFSISAVGSRVEVISALGCLVLFAAGLIFALYGALSVRRGDVKPRRGEPVSLWACAAIQTGALVLGLLGGILPTGAVVGLILSLVTLAARIVYHFLYLRANANADADTGSEPDAARERRSRAFLAGIAALGMLVLPILFHTPFLSYEKGGTPVAVIPAEAVAGGKNSLLFGSFIACFLIAAVSFVFLIRMIAAFGGTLRRAVSGASALVWWNLAAAGGWFAASYIYAFIMNSKGYCFYSDGRLPFLFMILVALLFAVVRGFFYPDPRPDRVREPLSAKARRGILAGSTVVFSLMTFLCLMTDIVRVTYSTPYGSRTVRVNGLELLRTYETMGKAYHTLAFLLLTVLVVSAALLLVSVTAFLGKSRFFDRLAVIGIAVNVLSVTVVGIAGKYFEMVQAVNIELILELLPAPVDPDALDVGYKVVSQAYLPMLISLGLLFVLLLLAPLTRAEKETAARLLDTGAAELSGVPAQPAGDEKENERKQPEETDEPEEAAPVTPAAPTPAPEAAPEAVPAPLPEGKPALPDFDACPAFTELDGKRDAFAASLDACRAAAFQKPTLPEIVRFVVAYARDCRLHLSYREEEIADFLSGLGAARLTILQGMSGTGKTSLPKIFTEALMGRCDIIEVESSWRDKNELLGYYNEFSRTYTPKKFTQALYRAKLNPEVPTLIVLDEMNLSRIEYYFSDFLSLMENEEDQRAVKLVNVRLFNTRDGERLSYAALSEDHTLYVPRNVWFIGTANRDESTFAISDKVYDRAHTMNFRRRAASIDSFGEPQPARFLDCGTLLSLMDEARASGSFRVEESETIRRVEALLAPYNISFGNRVARQIEAYVRLYCACFADAPGREEEAVESILLSEVVCKLENKTVENKSALAAEFEKLGLARCGAFIRKLNEEFL